MNFLRHDPPRKGELKRLQGFIAREVNRIASRVVAAKVKNVIATSGTAAALAAAASHLRKNGSRQRHGGLAQEMTRIAKRLARLPVSERRQIEGIGPRRAEIIVAGAMVYHELLDRCHLKGFRYSPLGLRDGLLAQMAAEHDRSTRSGKQIESERWESITRAVDSLSRGYETCARCARIRDVPVLGAAFGARASAGIPRVAFGGGDAL